MLGRALLASDDVQESINHILEEEMEYKRERTETAGWKRSSTVLTHYLPHLESSNGSLRKRLEIHVSRSIFQRNNKLHHLAKERFI